MKFACCKIGKIAELLPLQELSNAAAYGACASAPCRKHYQQHRQLQEIVDRLAKSVRK